MTPADIIKMAKDNKVEFCDMRFGDLFGRLHHFTLPIAMLEESLFEDGIPFDGSSIRAWKSIDKSDMLMKPDLTSGYMDPFRDRPTLNMLNDVCDPRTGERYDRCPRSIAQKALDYLRSTGIGDTAYFGPEPEFFVFDGIRYGSERHRSFYEIESSEGPWTSGAPDSLGHKIRHKEGYSPVTPQDTLMDYRNETLANLISMRVSPRLHHHEVATAGQCEIGTQFDTIVKAGDIVNKIKYASKNTAYRYGKTATFMPKPISEDNGSGMHVHTSIWKGDKNLFAGDNYSQLSQTALYAIGGILRHGRSIQVFTNPTVNSYRRLIPGYEAPVKLAYSVTNRSAAIRVPYSPNDKGRRIEFRCPDSSGSSYLIFASILMACIDGIKNQIDPGEPLDKNIYDLPPEETKDIASTCHNLEEAMEELERDSEWLKAGEVFSEDMLQAYLNDRRANEVEPLKLRPNPMEFDLYYDA